MILEREAYDSQKKLEQIRATRESFEKHLLSAGINRSQELESGGAAQGTEPCPLAPWMMRARNSASNAVALARRPARDAGDLPLPEAAPRSRPRRREQLPPVAADRPRAHPAAHHLRSSRTGHLPLEGLRMPNKERNAPSLFEFGHPALRRNSRSWRSRENELPRKDAEAGADDRGSSRGWRRRKCDDSREEVLARASAGRQPARCLDEFRATCATLGMRSWPSAARRGSLRKERREGRIIFLVLVLVLAAPSSGSSLICHFRM